LWGRRASAVGDWRGPGVRLVSAVVAAVDAVRVDRGGSGSRA